MSRRYVFVTVQFSANKCAIELYEKPEKGEKMACPSVLWKSDHLFSSQWIWGDGQSSNSLRFNQIEGSGAPGETRTRDPLLRSRSNYFAKSCQRSG
jgi:hypothetical protein